MSKTKWACMKCGYEETVEHHPHIDVRSAIQLIADSHREIQPSCDGNLSTIRIIADEAAWAAEKAAAKGQEFWRGEVIT